MQNNKNIDFDKLLEFEKKSGVFLIKNDRGIHLWDIFHPEFGELYFQNLVASDNKIKKTKRRIIRIVKMLFNPCSSINLIYSLFFLFIDKRKFDNLFFQTSRNQFNGNFIDQNSYDTYVLKRNERNLLLEVFSNVQSPAYLEKFIYISKLKIIARILCHPRISISDRDCITRLLVLVNNYYPDLDLKYGQLENMLITFYRDIFLYRILLKRHGIKNVFVTQNGFQKGLFYIGKELGINVFEFQHGVIRKEHLSYSYPNIQNIQDYIYTPKVFLTFSDYWTNSFFCPIKHFSIGNNYFSNPVIKKSSEKLLVISAYSFGVELAEFIAKACSNGVLKYEQIVFKLHPHEYSDKAKYERIFNNKILVLTNESSVNTLLSDCKVMISVNSTAVYEALQSETRVLLYKISPYEQLKPVFNDRNLFLFSNTEELEKGLKAKLPVDYKAPVFFEKCSSEKIQNVLKLNE